jgi:hypothetical protein
MSALQHVHAGVNDPDDNTRNLILYVTVFS